MRWKSLTTESSLIMKGIAILMIATHNFMHLFPFPKENEFDFSFERTSNMLNLLWEQPENSARVLSSFFGHFGVEVFIFLSAYGLTKKYLKQPLHYFTFIKERMIKVYPIFIVAIAIWLLLEGFYSYGIFGPFKMLYWNFEAILLKLTLLSNFIPDMGLEPIGPWWFIPFIFQFYFVFPWLLKIFERWKETGLLVISIFCLVFTSTVGGSIEGVNLYFTIVPYMPVFSLGIYLAKKDVSITEIKIPVFVILLALITFILSNTYSHLWVFSNISFTILFLVLMNSVLPKMKGSIKKALIFTGKISMGLFLVNGFLRFPMLRWAIEADNWLLTIALCLVFLSISFVVAIVLHRADDLIAKKLKNLRQTRKNLAVN